MKKHANLSIFVPHVGCPQNCSFCNQRSISGTQKAPTSDEVRVLCEKYLPSNGENTQIAFFGGSFTAINREYMLELLTAVKPFILNNRASGVRISTRPDAINDEILTILKEYHVTSIELGAQSMDDEILSLNDRGHNAKDVEDAVKLIKSYGFEVGVQMMVGLYGETDFEKYAINTAEKLIALNPDTVRIYPTVVVGGTRLAKLYKEDKYTPITVEQSASICAKLIVMFEKANVNIIRVGLHADESLEGDMLAGGYHPAMKQLAQSEIFYNNILKTLKEKDKSEYIILVPKGQKSTVQGQKNVNLKLFKDMGYNVIIKECDDVIGYNVVLE